MSWVCNYCKRAVPCTTDGVGKKQSIHLRPDWTTVSLTILDAGEQCYPCPECEKGNDGRRTILHWDHADIRLHKRLRQHHARAHQQLLKEKFTSAEIVEFYNDARRLRCELIHGPDDPGLSLTKAAPAKEPDTPPKDPERAKSPETPRRRARNVSAKESHAIILPPSYLEWLRNELRMDSVASYTGVTKTYLHWIEKNRGRQGVLADVWDLECVQAFIAELKPQVAPTTVFNYLCALTTAQRFVRSRGEVEPSPATIFSFAAMLRQASRGKSAHQKVVAETKRKTSVTLHEVKAKILENPELYARFKGLAKLCEDGGSLSQTQFTWATGFALFNLQASNFKRNGNTLKIPFKPVLKKIQSALKHRKACEIVITNATKTGGTEVFSIVKMQRLKVLYKYATSVRPTAMGSGQCPQFFVNSVGKRLTKASTYITALGKSVGLPKLTIKDLRSRIETEAALRGKSVDRAAIADHLAHTEATRDRHYLLMDRRRSREAAFAVEKLIDEAEPAEDSDADTSLDSSDLNSDELEYDDDTSSNADDDSSPEESEASTSPSSEPGSDGSNIVTVEDELSTSDESKNEGFVDLTLSPSESPLASTSTPMKRGRVPTGLSSDSDSADASPTLPTPTTKRPRLDARNSEPTLDSSPTFQVLLHDSPPLRVDEASRHVTPTRAPPKGEGQPSTTESESTSSPGSENLFTENLKPDKGNTSSPLGVKNAATKPSFISSVSPEPTTGGQASALHQRSRTSSENAAAVSREGSDEDEGSRSDPGENSPPWTRTLRRRVYTVKKQK